MRNRRTMLFSILAAVAFGLIFVSVDVGKARAGDQHVISRGDCTFLRGPETYLGRPGRRLRDLSAVTERVSAQIAPATTPVAEEIPIRNVIDRYIFDKMRRDGIPHAGLSSDAEFQRRVTLDLTGRIPTRDEVFAFSQDVGADKRERLVDQLMDSPEFIDRWTLFFGDLFRNTESSSNVVRFFEGRNAFYRFIHEALQNGWPYDDMVTVLLTANGNGFQYGPADWIAGGVTPMGPIQDTYDALWVNAATQFLGLAHFDCLLCHNGAGHLNQISLWGSRTTRFQAWELAAFFSRTTIQRQAGQGDQPYLVSERATGGYDLNTNFGNRVNRTPQGAVRQVTPRYIFTGRTAQGNFRESLAQAITSDPQFARATVNYLWAELMGLGLVDPPDTFDPARIDASNPPPKPWTLQPTHPELLDALANDLINNGYHFPSLVREIATSSAYQLSSRFPGEWKPAYTPYFARHFIRRLKAEEVHDAVARATETPGNYRLRGFDQPVPWAMQLPDVNEPVGNGASTFLNTFLRGNRGTSARSDDVTIPQQLAMMNDNFVISRVRSSSPTSLVRRLIDAGLGDPQVVYELYVRVLSREPSPGERDVAVRSFSGRNRTTAAEDLLWVLFNKVDFLFNY